MMADQICDTLHRKIGTAVGPKNRDAIHRKIGKAGFPKFVLMKKYNKHEKAKIVKK